MAGLQGAVESAAPVSKLHDLRSFDVDAFPVPGGREETWRFTPLRRLRGLHADASLADGKVEVTVDADPSVTVELAQHGDPRVGTSFVPSDRVSARAFAGFREATIVTVPADVATDRPTTIRVHGHSTEHPAAGHLLIRLEHHAEAEVVIDYSGSATYAENIEFVVGDGAQLVVVAVHEWQDDAVHLGYHHVSLGRDAAIRHSVVTLGGGVVRIAPSVSYAGPGGEAELRGIYFADAGQHLEHRLFIDHSQPSCRSRVTYKGALQGQGAHSVWIGDVAIRPEATGTDTYEYNRNLVLTDGTRTDSVPNLEILTGEVVGAGHASASGRLEDLHLFYLMARGIPFDEARRLVIRGYFGQLIHQIEVPELRDRISAAVEAELAVSAGPASALAGQR